MYCTLTIPDDVTSQDICKDIVVKYCRVDLEIQRQKIKDVYLPKKEKAHRKSIKEKINAKKAEKGDEAENVKDRERARCI